MKAQRLAAEGTSVVLVRPDTSPSDLPGMLASKAIVTGAGGLTCHAAIVARDLGIPAIVGILDLDTLREGEVVTVDGTNGRVFSGELACSAPILSREILLMQKWQRRRYTPRIGLEFITEQVSSATLLADLYMTDMMVAAARNTKLESRATRLRSEAHVSIAERLATYLLLATAAEVRHFWDRAQSRPGCENAATFVNTHLDSQEAARHGSAGRSAVQKRAIDFARQSTDSLPTLVEQFTILFRYASWSSAFGGERWAVIAECLVRFLTGQLSPTVFADQVFDLRHNGNRLFDKHPMIQETPRIKELLDLKKVNWRVAALKVSCDTHGAKMSPTVFQMWQTGDKAGLW